MNCHVLQGWGVAMSLVSQVTECLVSPSEVTVPSCRRATAWKPWSSGVSSAGGSGGVTQGKRAEALPLENCFQTRGPRCPRHLSGLAATQGVSNYGGSSSRKTDGFTAFLQLQ